MASLIYSTELVLNEPWLVDRSALEELDKIIDDCWGNLLARQEEFVEKKAQEMLAMYYGNLSADEREPQLAKLRKERKQGAAYSQQKKVVLALGEGKVFEANSILEVLKEPALNSELPKSFTVRLKTTEADVHFSIEGGFGSRLRIQVSPEQDELSKRTFVELREWAFKHRIPWWQRAWYKLGSFYWALWFFAVVVSALIVSSTGDAAVRAARIEAHQLLNEGLSSENLLKAIELLLRIESRYVPEVSATQTPLWFNLLLYVGFATVVVISIRPKIVIGIGMGAARIEAWRRWAKFVYVALPALFFSTFLLPYLQNILSKLLTP